MKSVGKLEKYTNKRIKLQKISKKHNTNSLTERNKRVNSKISLPKNFYCYCLRSMFISKKDKNKINSNRDYC